MNSFNFDYQIVIFFNIVKYYQVALNKLIFTRANNRATMASVKLRIRKSRVNKNGESPIFIQIFSSNTKKEVSAQVAIDAELWDDNRFEVRRRHPRQGQLNAILRARINEFQDAIDELQKMKLAFSAQDIINRRNSNIESNLPKNHVITEFLKDYIDRNPDGWKVSTFRTYGIFINCFTALHKGLCFQDLNLDIVKKYHLYLQSKELAINTISNRMKILRRSISLANEAGIISHNPMVGYKRNREEGRREFLTVEELKLFEGYNAPTVSKQKIVDMFVFNAFTGLRIGDLLTLKTTDFKFLDGVIKLNLRMNKTDDFVDHKLSSVPKMIFDKYANYESVFIFNLLNEGKNLSDPYILDKEINRKTSYFNKILKETASVLDIPKVVTCHVARHSFATILLSKGASIEVISKLLGHKDIRETQIYTKVLGKAKEEAIDLLDNI